MTTTQTAATLEDFCGENSGRYKTSTPWVRDGWRYATDARVCIREPAVGKPDTKDRPLPPVDTVFSAFPPRDEFTEAWPGTVCPQCGHMLREVEIADRKIAGHYAALIGRLGDVKCCPAGDKWALLYFMAAGGRQGAVMPIM